jgi:hypothetical protein
LVLPDERESNVPCVKRQDEEMLSFGSTDRWLRGYDKK